MASLKSLTVFLLFFLCASALRCPTQTSTENPDDDCSSDEKQQEGEGEGKEHRIVKRQPATIDVKRISTAIWSSRKSINVQYYNNPGYNGLFYKGGFAHKVFRDLFPYYNRYLEQPDPCQGSQTQKNQCQQAQNDFINAISSETSATGADGPISVLYQSLKNAKNFRRRFLRDYEAFKDELKRIWFDPYSRSDDRSILGSSGFEHVFLGEMNQSHYITGLHNWMRMWWAEAKDGSFEARSTDPPHIVPGNIVASVRFKWHFYGPRRSSFFTQTTPATEIALYTLCFLAQPDDICEIKLGGTSVYLETYAFGSAGLIGSAFPVYP